MIGVIFGEKGTGKTKRLLNNANTRAAVAKGSIAFIDADTSYMFDLVSTIRFINASEYDITSTRSLYGFLCGIYAQDFDLECIYVDSFKSFAGSDLEGCEMFFRAIKEFSDKNHVDIIFSISAARESMPSYFKELTAEITE